MGILHSVLPGINLVSSQDDPRMVTVTRESQDTLTWPCDYIAWIDKTIEFLSYFGHLDNP